MSIYFSYAVLILIYKKRKWSVYRLLREEVSEISLGESTIKYTC